MEPVKLGDFLKWEPHYPEAIIGEGVLHVMNKLIMYGREGIGKSMLAMNLDMSLIGGVPWAGFDIKGDNHKVFYLQMEIPHPLLHKRLMKMYNAWKVLYGDKNGNMLDRFYVWTEPFLKLDNPTGYKFLRMQLERVRPTVLIVDPLYKALSGNILDPNSARAFVDSMDMLITEFQFSLVLIHHTRKGKIDEDQDMNPNEDMLGSAVFSWWADTIVKVIKKGEKDRKVLIQLNFDKVRHAEDVVEPREVIFDREDLMFYSAEKKIVV
ncbi:hypothetical protein LCGC14_1716100 [marine sediment metagenome]|uniref:Uncharacterized protein n=1 Tax=marine sediment metagenome TaxID=412755 RepID=A0A0F9HDJ2_9ZZZZ